jgi:hypothetical protein
MRMYVSAERELSALWIVPRNKGDLNLSDPVPSSLSKGTDTASEDHSQLTMGISRK